MIYSRSGIGVSKATKSAASNQAAVQRYDHSILLQLFQPCGRRIDLGFMLEGVEIGRCWYRNHLESSQFWAGVNHFSGCLVKLS